jgi:hypothetical protein
MKIFALLVLAATMTFGVSAGAVEYKETKGALKFFNYSRYDFYCSFQKLNRAGVNMDEAMGIAAAFRHAPRVTR